MVFANIGIRPTKNKRSGIVSDPNQLDDEEYIVRLVGKVLTVSVSGNLSMS